MNSDQKKILVAFNGTKNSRKALKKAFFISKNSGSDLYVLIVLEVSDLTKELPAYNNILDAATSKVIVELATIVNETIDLGLPNGIAPKINVLIGNPKRIIVDFVRTKKIDLLVIGKSMNKKKDDKLLKTTTSYIMNYARCDVLLTS